MTDYTQSPGIAVPKSKQLVNDRKHKLTQKQMGSISNKVRDEVKARSNGYCEVRFKCLGALGVDMAHLKGRSIINSKTTAKDLKYACKACHTHLDTTGEGVRHKKSLRELDAG